MKALLRFTAAVDWVSLQCARVALWLVLLACLVSAANAGARYVFSVGSNAFLEIQWYMFAGIVMLGAAHALKVNEHVRVDVFYGRLSSDGKARLDLAGLVVFLMPAVLVMLWLSWRFFTISFQGGEVSSNPGGLIRWPVKLLLPFGFALLALQGVAEIIKRVAFLRGELTMDIQYERPKQ